MPAPDQPRDKEGRTFADYVADQVMTAIIESGMSVRAVALASGLERTGVQDRLNGLRSFNVEHLSRIAAAVGITPAALIAAEGFIPI